VPQTDSGSETELYYAIAKLPPKERCDLMALFTFRLLGIRSYNVTRKSAANANLHHLADYLSSTKMLHEFLSKGLHRYKNHS
jgi:hypothetical protein